MGLFRSKPTKFIEKFVAKLTSEYDVRPYSNGNPDILIGWRFAELGVRILQDGQEIGHLSFVVQGTSLHIYGFGRRNRIDLSQRDGRMTKIIRELLDGLVAAGITDITLTDQSDGYWTHIAQRYPTIYWNGELPPILPRPVAAS
jgi:hypothetical protein